MVFLKTLSTLSAMEDDDGQDVWGPCQCSVWYAACMTHYQLGLKWIDVHTGLRLHERRREAAAEFPTTMHALHFYERPDDSDKGQFFLTKPNKSKSFITDDIKM